MSRTLKIIILYVKFTKNRPLDAVVKNIAIGAGDLGFDYPIGQFGHSVFRNRHRCDVSSELCCPGAK